MHLSVLKFHGLSAVFFGAFIIVHITVHLFALSGNAMHLVVLSFIQKIYRNQIVEPLLFVTIIVQIFTGIKLMLRKYRLPNKKVWAWIQIISGLYLIVFLINHTGAALITRYIFKLDTNFYWVASTVNVAPYKYFFIPYYFLAIISIFAHIAAAIHFRTLRNKNGQKGALLILILGVVISTVIVATFCGVFYPIDLPHKYLHFFDNF